MHGMRLSCGEKLFKSEALKLGATIEIAYILATIINAGVTLIKTSFLIFGFANT